MARKKVVIDGKGNLYWQHAALIYSFVHVFVLYVYFSLYYATSKQVTRLQFGMLTALTNIRCYGRWKTPLCGRQPSVDDCLWWKTTLG